MTVRLQTQESALLIAPLLLRHRRSRRKERKLEAAFEQKENESKANIDRSREGIATPFFLSAFFQNDAKKGGKRQTEKNR
mmetsp:Transcript_37696/g.74128  ORF Transcript_37696/g.74128 Transcript_37696/m.74128 type:complete len:80 (+) Transcript_37696:257-496(+)